MQQDDDQPTPTTPEPAAVDAPTPTRRRSRGVVAVAAALAIGLGGAGVGYGVAHAVGNRGVAVAPSSAQGSQDESGQQQGPWGSGSLQRGGPPQQQEQTSTGGTRATSSQLTGLVRIATTLGYQDGEAAGTGMVLTSDGEVVTNHHVVAGATKIEVTVMSTGETYTATVVGTDAKDDVAVLRLKDASGLDTVRTDTSALSVGDAVTAVGDANGTEGYLSSVTGRVTALDQDITTQSEGSAAGERLTGLLEMSNDVISGDSGGATYDGDGEVVGMTTAASSGSSDIVGYAIPISKVLRIVDDLTSGVTSSRYAYGNPAFLGVALGSDGTTVAGVYRGTPAATAGLEAGDSLTAVDGTRTTTSAALRSAIAAHDPGDSISITWTDSSGASHTKTVTLMTGPVA